MPSQNSHETAMPSSPRSATEGRKKNHHAVGVFPSIGAATASVIDLKSWPPRMSVGRPAMGS
jgi:hypothetical protein